MEPCSNSSGSDEYRMKLDENLTCSTRLNENTENTGIMGYYVQILLSILKMLNPNTRGMTFLLALAFTILLILRLVAKIRSHVLK